MFLHTIWAGDPFSLSNKMSIDTVPTTASPLYLVSFKIHIQTVPDTCLVKHTIQKSDSKSNFPEQRNKFIAGQHTTEEV